MLVGMTGTHGNDQVCPGAAQRCCIGTAGGHLAHWCSIQQIKSMCLALQAGFKTSRAAGTNSQLQ